MKIAAFFAWLVVSVSACASPDATAVPPASVPETLYVGSVVGSAAPLGTIPSGGANGAKPLLLGSSGGPRRIREGSAVLNASPDDFGYATPPPSARPRLSRADADGSPPPRPDSFRLWRDGDTWHLQAPESPPSTMYRARLEPVTEVTVDGRRTDAAFRLVLRSIVPRAGTAKGANPHLATGFDLVADGNRHGITFLVAPGACFSVALRIAEDERLAPLIVGAGGKRVVANGNQDTFEVCP